MKISSLILKEKFIEIIKQKKTFEEASDWALSLIRKNNSHELNWDKDEDVDTIFSAIIFLGGVDLINERGTYLYTIDDVRDEYQEIFHEPAP